MHDQSIKNCLVWFGSMILFFLLDIPLAFCDEKVDEVLEEIKALTMISENLQQKTEEAIQRSIEKAAQRMNDLHNKNTKKE